METKLEQETLNLLKRLKELKHKINDEFTDQTHDSNEIIKSIALSDKINKDLKELLIVLQTTIMTELVSNKNKTYILGNELIDAIDLAITHNVNLTKIIKELKERIEPKPKPKPKFFSKETILEILKTYKLYLGVGIVFFIIWTLFIFDPDATLSLINALNIKFNLK